MADTEHAPESRQPAPLPPLDPWAGTPAPELGVATLADWRVIEAAGADTWSFLQSQLTQDVGTLPADAARLAGYCTAKGRMLASMVAWGDAGESPRARLLVHASIVDALVKRLSMFVLRAKVKLAALPQTVYGVDADDAGAARLAGIVGALPASAWTRAELASGTWIAAPAVAGRQRWWWLPAGDDAQSVHATLAADAIDADAWRRGDIAAGLPWIEAASQDVFIPQSVNFELAEGVSFRKGCYPGQEVVARSHYLGKVKRRMFAGVAEGAVPPVAGADVYHSSRADEPVGRVVNAAGAPGSAALLFETTLASIESGSLHVGAADGPVIAVRGLPYAIV